MPEKALISVVITAYNRREYLFEAVKSALSQTLSREFYEIIVIKNFRDDHIDNFLIQNDVKSVIADGVEGMFPYIALNLLKGDIISFLDDDDLFKMNKLELVSQIFTDAGIGYYHNSAEIISNEGITGNKVIGAELSGGLKISNDSKSKYIYPIDKKMLYVNNSCVSIRRSIIEPKSEFLKSQTANIDRFFYVTALLSNLSLYFDDRTLTFYRIHRAQTGALILNDFNALVSKKLEFITKSIDASNNLLRMTSNTALEAYGLIRIINLKLSYNFWSNENKFSISFTNLIFYIKNRDFIEIPLFIFYKTPRFIHKALIRFIYNL